MTTRTPITLMVADNLPNGSVLHVANPRTREDGVAIRRGPGHVPTWEVTGREGTYSTDELWVMFGYPPEADVLKRGKS